MQKRLTVGGLCFVFIILVLGASQPSVIQADQENTDNLVFLPLVAKDYVPVIIPAETKVLDSTTLNLLEEVNFDFSILTFAGTTPQLNSLAVDDVIVSEPTTLAPFGLLRKVSGISVTHGKFVVSTESANLEDAIEQGAVRLKQELTSRTVNAITSIDGVQVSAKDSTEGLSDIDFSFSDVELVDGIRANGNMAMDMDLEFDLEIRDFSVKEVELVLDIIQSSELSITSDVTTDNISQDIEIAEFELRPILVFIGYVPVVIDPEVVILLRLNGDAGEFTVSVTNSFTSKSGVAYRDGSWNSFHEAQNKFNSSTTNILDKSFSISAHVGAGVEFEFYSAIGVNPDVEVVPFVGFELETDSSLECWVLTGQAFLSYEIELDILGSQLGEYSGETPPYEKVISVSDNCVPSLTVEVDSNNSRSEVRWHDHYFIETYNGSSATILVRSRIIGTPSYSTVLIRKLEIEHLNPQGVSLTNLGSGECDFDEDFNVICTGNVYYIEVYYRYSAPMNPLKLFLGGTWDTNEIDMACHPMFLFTHTHFDLVDSTVPPIAQVEEWIHWDDCEDQPTIVIATLDLIER